MNRFIIVVILLICNELCAMAQADNPWLDSTQVNHSKIPLCIANGIIVNISEINLDFVSSMNVVNDKQTNARLGHLADNGCIYIEADQQFDVITPRVYQQKKTLPDSTQTVVFMLNGTIISDTLLISKASVRRVDLLLAANHAGTQGHSVCLSIWTLSNEERGLLRPKNEIRIRGDQKMR